jgi:thioredoxin reductase (NADPH)
MTTESNAAPDRPSDCLIIGGGPAGLTAATYLRRFHRRVVVFDDGRSRARWIPQTHNCPGFPKGVSGIELLQRLRQQATEYGARIQTSTVRTLQQTSQGWQASDGNTTWTAPSVILATGVEDVLPPMAKHEFAHAIREGWLRLCAICDGYEVTDRPIAVLGPIEKALAHACFLRAFSDRVTAIPTGTIPRSGTDGFVKVSERARQLAIAITAPFQRLSFENGGAEVLDADGLTHRFDSIYMALGSPGRVELAIQAGLALQPQGEIATNAHMGTDVGGLYAIGDVVTDLNQIAVAFGHAAVAATAVHRALPPRPRTR